jgi:ferritin-like metal-binding protein YciE
MEENNKPIATLHDLLDYDSQKFTSAEIELRNSLPSWVQKAGSLKLKAVLQKYLDFVQDHVQKFSAFFEEERISSLSVSNKIMLAFIEDANEKLNNCADQQVIDACLLASIQGINHFKISLYGTAAAFAKELGMEKFASVFHEAEVNEKQIDDRLSQLAEHEINISAKTPIVLPN